MLVLTFIIFEIIAQTILVINFFKIKEQIKQFINSRILNFKITLVSILIVVAFVSIPFLAAEGYKSFKHALEWNFFIGVISFYLLTFFSGKNNETPSSHTLRYVNESFGSSFLCYCQASRPTILALLRRTFCPPSLNLSVFPRLAS